jgi:hypothetical protein
LRLQSYEKKRTYNRFPRFFFFFLQKTRRSHRATRLFAKNKTPLFSL